MDLADIDSYVLLVIWIVCIPVGVFAFVHALTQRADAFTAVGKLSKPAWLGITGAGLAALVLFKGPGYNGAFFWIAGLVAVLVYLVDMRPKITEITRGGGRW